MRPGVARKPGMLKSRQARLAASQRFGKSDDFKVNALRIGKREFVLALIAESIPFVGDAAETPSAEPITLGSADLRDCTNLQLRLGNYRQYRPFAGSGSSHHFHEKNLAQTSLGGQMGHRIPAPPEAD